MIQEYSDWKQLWISGMFLGEITYNMPIGNKNAT